MHLSLLEDFDDLDDLEDRILRGYALVLPPSPDEYCTQSFRPIISKIVRKSPHTKPMGYSIHVI